MGYKLNNVIGKSSDDRQSTKHYVEKQRWRYSLLFNLKSFEVYFLLTKKTYLYR